MARFDCAIWKPISCNTGGPIDPIGLILHHAVADGSLYNFFNSPAAEVSAHFWVSRSGVIEQYVDSTIAAWHGMSLNARYCGVETEGCVAAPHAEAMTEAMIDGLAAIYAEGAARHGWPNALAETDGHPGFGYHRMAVATACPCDVRLGERPEILALAFAGPAPTPPPPSPPAAEAGVAPPWPGRYFEYPPGTQGADVAQWQEQMYFRGWVIDVDGVYGPASRDICFDFQTEKGLAADGIVGPDTWAAAWTAPIT